MEDGVPFRLRLLLSYGVTIQYLPLLGGKRYVHIAARLL